MSSPRCPSCRRDLSDGQRFCGHCGADVGSRARAGTPSSPAPAEETTTRHPGASGREWADAGDTGARFAPGTVVGERYRIVALLGRGGMGEVYRADDLKLARPVALKFLPERVERDPTRLSRLLNEVRTALRVSHPNVCRVHDIQQEGGRHFITMEFVDGDDLSTLLRRIGRLPPDKALEIARQLCAGLGAAHAAGVLHRDLKPANVMIDGRGQVKITDFGLAGLAGGFSGDEVRAGTPAYMAPEQIAGESVSESSDLYALGLVLYELYTGKPAYEGATAAERAQRRSSAPTSPSSHVTDIDPAVERVILRCLEPDPSERPTSALAVVAALPGGDPLAAAIAAGETPAPELVAEAGAVGGLRPGVAVAWLAAFVVLLVIAVAGNTRYLMLSRVELPKSGPVLEDRAREIVVDLGFDEPPRDRIHDFAFREDLIRHLERGDVTAETWQALGRSQPAPIRFGYRQSPEWLIYENRGWVGDWVDRRTTETPGEVRVHLDPVGRLLGLDAIPPELPDPSIEDGSPDWNALLEAAGLDASQLEQVEPRWVPRRGFDTRRAWTGTYPDAPEVDIRVEAAALGARPVAFRIVEPWTRPAESAVVPLNRRDENRIGAVLGPAMFIGLLCVAGIFAWRNARLGRGDRRTALRFAIVLTVIRFLWFPLVPLSGGGGHLISSFTSHLGWSMYRFLLAYVLYLAVEPYARRLWPRMLTSWVRLFDGRFRDPLVGRDLLIGVTVGVTTVAVNTGILAGLETFGHHVLNTYVANTAVESLRGFRGALLGWLGVITNEVEGAFLIVLFVLLLRLLLRRDVFSLIGILVILFLFELGNRDFVVGYSVAAVSMAAICLVLFRVGLLAMIAAFLTRNLLVTLPLTFDLDSWRSAPTWIVVGTTTALVLWAFRAALAGRPVFRERLFEG